MCGITAIITRQVDVSRTRRRCGRINPSLRDLRIVRVDLSVVSISLSVGQGDIA
jgi:hypothetical protein